VSNLCALWYPGPAGPCTSLVADSVSVMMPRRSTLSESPKKHPFGFQMQQEKLQRLVQEQHQKPQERRPEPRERLVESQTPTRPRNLPRSAREKENFLDAIFDLPGALLGPLFEDEGNCSCLKIVGEENGLLAQRRRKSPAKKPLSRRRL